MTQLLHLNTSIFGDEGQSSKLANQFVSELESRTENLMVTRRNFADTPIPHLTAEVFNATLTPADDRTGDQKEAAKLADTLIEELLEADVIVIGLPMYNFNVPSMLKAWFDHVARAGTTFKYTESGPVGLLDNAKKVYVFAARGGVYEGTDNDVQTPYVKQFLGLLNITDIEFVYAEGLNLGEDSKNEALESAARRLERMAA